MTSKPDSTSSIGDLNCRVKACLRTASSRIRLKNVLRLAEGEGCEIASSFEAMRKFVETDKRQLSNIDDLYRLDRFFSATYLGRELRKEAAGTCSATRGFLDGLVAEQSFPFRITGSYLVYHTAFQWEHRYSVRTMAIADDGRGDVGFTEFLGNINSGVSPVTSTSVKDATEYQHQGIVRCYLGTLQFLSLNKNQSLGARFIVGRPIARDGRASLVIGRMMGMTAEGMPYERDVLLARTGDMPVLEKDRSCIKALSELNSDELRMFGLLASRRTHEAFADNALDAALDRSKGKARPSSPARTAIHSSARTRRNGHPSV